MPAHTVFPFLNENNKYKYVDADFNTVIAGEYKRASLFTATGFAVVMNDSFQSAVIDKKGALLIPFGAYEIDLAVVNGITLFRKTLDYNNPLRFWNWSYSLFGGLNKAVMRSKIEIGVLETKQRLLFKRMMTNAYPKPSLSPITVDEQHFLLNDCLYRIKDQKIRKLKNNIIRITGHSTLLKKYKGVYSLFSLSGKRIIKEDFIPVDNWYFNTKHETILLEGLNEYVKRNTFPKILKGKKSGKIYSYPDFDKTLPAEISGANEITIEQIKKVSIIVSVPQSIYFLLGYRVNETNRYDWLVIDQHGNLLPDLPVENFYITSQLGEILWPDKMSLLPDTFLNEGWKLKKLSKINGSGKHFVALIKKENTQSVGVWNRCLQNWLIDPLYNKILVLDAQNDIYAIEQTNEGGYQLYNAKENTFISNKHYHTVSVNGYVSRKKADGRVFYFFIDIYSGKEFL